MDLLGDEKPVQNIHALFLRLGRLGQLSPMDCWLRTDPLSTVARPFALLFLFGAALAVNAGAMRWFFSALELTAKEKHVGVARFILALILRGRRADTPILFPSDHVFPPLARPCEMMRCIELLLHYFRLPPAVYVAVEEDAREADYDAAQRGLDFVLPSFAFFSDNVLYSIATTKEHSALLPWLVQRFDVPSQFLWVTDSGYLLETLLRYRAYDGVAASPLEEMLRCRPVDRARAAEAFAHLAQTDFSGGQHLFPTLCWWQEKFRFTRKDFSDLFPEMPSYVARGFRARPLVFAWSIREFEWTTEEQRYGLVEGVEQHGTLSLPSLANYWVALKNKFY